MKKVNAFLTLVVLGIIFSIGIMAQPPKPPAGQGTSGNQPPAGPTGSPIDPGTGIFLILAAGYGLKKIYNIRQESAK
jgi:hypothetical protein